MKKKVLISGAGVAGLACALKLDPKKYEITLIEKEQEFNSKGFAIILWKSGFDVIESVLDDINEIESEVIEQANFYGGDDLELLHSANIAEYGHSVERKKLIDALARQLENTHEHVKLHLGTVIASVEKKANKTVVSLSNDKQETFDVVILAEGTHSSIRQKLFKTTIKSEAFRVTYEWVRQCPDLPNELFYGFIEDSTFLLQKVQNDALIGFYNYGESRINKEIENKIVGLLKKDSGNDCILDKSTSKDFGIERVDVDDAVNGSIVLAGDAFHGNSPTIAFGTSAALEDIEVLCRKLNSINNDKFVIELHKSLEEYSRERRKRLKEIYAFQDFAEKLSMSKNHTQIELVKIFIKMGGKYPLEYWMKHLVRKGSKL